MYRQAFTGGGQTDLSSPLEFLGGLKDIEFESLACKEGFMSMPMGLRKFTLTRIAKFTKFIKQFNPLPEGSNNWSWVMSFKDGCLGSGFSVMSLATCTAWVLAHENMDYKRCPEKLGWDKASSCKAK